MVSKKFMSTAIAVCMVANMVPIAAFATTGETGENESGEHTEEVVHNHSWSDDYSSDSENHWKECVTDGCNITESTLKGGYGAHEFSGETDIDCNVCSYVRELANGDNELNQDNNSNTDEIPAAPVFMLGDGTENQFESAREALKSNSRFVKAGYDVEGWYDADGNRLRNMSNAEPGKVYTARWENNGNSVRTEVLDLRHSDDDKNTSEGWTWDEDNCVLTLNNVTIDSNDGFGLLLPENKEVEIRLKSNSENFIRTSDVLDSDSVAIYMDYNRDSMITLSGNGELNVESGEVITTGSSSYVSAGILATNLTVENGDIEINSGELDANSKSDSISAAVYLDNTFTMNGGSLEANGANSNNGSCYGIHAKDVLIKDGYKLEAVGATAAIDASSNIGVTGCFEVLASTKISFKALDEDDEGHIVDDKICACGDKYSCEGIETALRALLINEDYKENNRNVVVTLSGEDKAVEVDGRIFDNVIKLDIDETSLNKVINKSIDTGVIVINLSELNSNVNTVEISTDIADYIVDAMRDKNNDIEGVKIIFQNGSLEFDVEAFKKIGSKATGDVLKIRLEKTGLDGLNTEQKNALTDYTVLYGYEAEIKSDSKVISDFGDGVVTIKISTTNLDMKDTKVFYVDNNGKLEELASLVEKQSLSWKVGHFSDFVVTSCNKAVGVVPNVDKENPETGAGDIAMVNTSVYGLGISAVAVIGAVAGLLKRD